MAITTALAASFVGSLLFNLAVSFYAPGDGGTAVALQAALLPFLIAGWILGVLYGLPVLALLGIPAALKLNDPIQERPHLARFVGLLVGALVGEATHLLLDVGDLLFGHLGALFGALYGLIWIWLLQKLPAGSPDVSHRNRIPHG